MNEGKKFKDIISDESLIKALNKMKFDTPTEVQAAAIEPMIAGKDIVVQAPTGTGKTAAFALPILHNIDPNLKAIQALILCPTRELAVQIAEVFRELSQFKSKLLVTTIYGGQAIQKQFVLLRRKPQIVVATPGRLIDHMTRKTIRLDNLSVLVLDEADRMLDMGFRPDLDKILETVKPDRQTALFSATISNDINQIARKYQKNAENIEIEQKSLTVDSVEQFYTVVAKNRKMKELIEIFIKYHPKRSLIFVNTKRMSETVSHSLKEKGYRCAFLHGDMRQSQRNKVMSMYKSGNLDLIVATDVAARGIDVDDIDMVINYDLPREQDSYIHRIGRTGRAETTGMAYNIIYKVEQGMINQLMADTKAPIKRVPPISGEPVQTAEEQSAESGNKPSNNRRKSKNYKPGNYSPRSKSKKDGYNKNAQSRTGNKNTTKNKTRNDNK